jgi:hypothetical protein
VENDIGLFIGAGGDSLTTERRVSLLCDVWTPDRSFKFPAGKRNLKVSASVAGSLAMAVVLQGTFWRLL